jgi:predicted nucleic acid-binding Zn ribbon protein
MDYLKRAPRSTSRCLECGDKISYGRTDKKFCSEECKNRHHNHKSRSDRFIKRKTISVLEKNYEILEGLLKVGVDTIFLSEALLLGFNPAYITSFSRVNHHDVYACFDITYTMTPSKICSISKIQNLSLNLQARSVKG